VFKDIAVLMKYRAEVTLTPLDDSAAEFEVRRLGFKTPSGEDDGREDYGRVGRGNR